MAAWHNQTAFACTPTCICGLEDQRLAAGLRADCKANVGARRRRHSPQICLGCPSTGTSPSGSIVGGALQKDGENRPHEQPGFWPERNRLAARDAAQRHMCPRHCHGGAHQNRAGGHACVSGGGAHRNRHAITEPCNRVEGRRGDHAGILNCRHGACCPGEPGLNGRAPGRQGGVSWGARQLAHGARASSCSLYSAAHACHSPGCTRHCCLAPSPACSGRRRSWSRTGHSCWSRRTARQAGRQAGCHEECGGCRTARLRAVMPRPAPAPHCIAAGAAQGVAWQACAGIACACGCVRLDAWGSALQGVHWEGSGMRSAAQAGGLASRRHPRQQAAQPPAHSRACAPCKSEAGLAGVAARPRRGAEGCAIGVALRSQGPLRCMRRQQCSTCCVTGALLLARRTRAPTVSNIAHAGLPRALRTPNPPTPPCGSPSPACKPCWMRREWSLRRTHCMLRCQHQTCPRRSLARRSTAGGRAGGQQCGVSAGRWAPAPAFCALSLHALTERGHSPHKKCQEVRL